MRRLASVFAAAFVPAVLGAQRPQCVAAPLPDPLPIPMQLVDSMALSASLAESIVFPTTFSLWYDRTGQLTHVPALTDSLVVRGLTATHAHRGRPRTTSKRSRSGRA